MSLHYHENRLIRIQDCSDNFEVHNVEDREIKLPGFNTLFAEFMGALAGDGHLTDSNYTYRIEFTLSRTEDRYYVDFLVNAFRSLFNMEPRVQMRSNSGNRVDIKVHSKQVHLYLSKFFPVGKKKRIFVPEWVDSKIMISSYLRGLMDTDGSLFFAKRGTYERNSYPVMEFKLNDANYLDQVEDLLDVVDIDFYRASDTKIQINGERRLQKWISNIGFSNPNRISRFYVWRLQNYCPPDTNLDERLRILGISPG